jgi:hypothetical protein
MRCAPLLVLLALQDSPEESRVRDWLKGLEQDRIEDRVEAEERLSELAPAWAPRLRKSLDGFRGEARERLAGILRKIEARRRLEELLPKPARIDLPEAPMDVDEILARISSQGRIPLQRQPPGGPARELRIPLRNATAWEAVDRLLAVHGGWGLGLGGGRVEVGAPAPKVRLLSHRGALAGWVSRLVVQETKHFGEPAERSSLLAMEAAWETGAAPARVRAMLKEARDDTGASLIPEGTAPTGESPVEREAAPSNGCGIEIAGLLPPADAAHRLTRLRVDLEFSYPVERETLSLDPSAATPFPKAFASTAVDVRLVSYSQEGTDWVAVLTFEPKSAPRGDLDLEGVLLGDGTGVSVKGLWAWDAEEDDEDGPLTIPVTFPRHPKGGEFRKLTISVVTRVHREILKLELADLPLD